MWGSTVTRTMGRHQHTDVLMPTDSVELMQYHRGRGLLGLFEIMRIRGAELITKVPCVNSQGVACSYQAMVTELLEYYRNANNVPAEQSPHFPIIRNAINLLNSFTQLMIPMEFYYQRDQMTVIVKVLFLDDSSKFDKAASDIINNRDPHYTTEIIYVYQTGSGQHSTSTPHITTTGFSYKQLGCFPTANVLQPRFRRATGTEADTIRGSAKSFPKILSTSIIAQCYGWREGDIIISTIPQIAGGINRHITQVQIVAPPSLN